MTAMRGEAGPGRAKHDAAGCAAGKGQGSGRCPSATPRRRQPGPPQVLVTTICTGPARLFPRPDTVQESGEPCECVQAELIFTQEFFEGIS